MFSCEMYLSLVFLLAFVLDTVSGQQYKCKKAYRPSEYIGNIRVPTNCKFFDLGCPRSWKSGVPEGSDAGLPLIYDKFLKCHEGYSICGYVPIDPKNGEVLGKSGVTIGAGVDLGSKTRSSFSSLPNYLVNKLEPYFGLQRGQAACAIIERPLVLTDYEATVVTNAFQNDVVGVVSRRYDADKVQNAKSFASLPRGIRTAIVSVWYQFGYPGAYPNFWDLVRENDWEGAVKELRDFYTNPKIQQPGDLRRRNDEADIIEASFKKCSRAVDLVFLIDESGSVSLGSFREGLDFVKNVIKSFSNENLKGNHGTKFGLSTFSNDYQSKFYLSSYQSTVDYMNAVDAVSYKGGGDTKLGAALGQILDDQFMVSRGLRPEENGLPRILIVLTDGMASDGVASPAQNVRDKNIAVYAIGIDGYDRSQLRQIASSESHVYTLSSYFKLETFISTITSSTCNEPRPLSLSTTVQTDVAKDSFQYFSYNINLSLNLRLNIFDLAGSTFVYASRSNPHPYKFDYDIAFDLASQKNKLIVISAKETRQSVVKRSSKPRQKIFVSVTADSDMARFTIEGNECDPMNCTEGTNQPAANHAISTLNPFFSGYLIAIIKLVALSVAICMVIQ